MVGQCRHVSVLEDSFQCLLFFVGCAGRGVGPSLVSAGAKLGRPLGHFIFSLFLGLRGSC